MDPIDRYRQLEQRVRTLFQQRGTTAERVETLDEMDRIWTQMDAGDRARVSQEKAS